MSFSTYITTWNGNPLNQVQDLVDKSVLKPNTRVILAFASFNFITTDYIPGILNLSLDDLKKVTDLVHSKSAKISLSIGGATYPFYKSELFERPGDLANNINVLINKCGFDGVDFDIEDSSSVVPANFSTNAASLINTLRSLNKDLNITLTTAAQAWAPNNYQKSLIDLTIGNLNAWQPMEYDIWIDSTSNYYNQIQWDINFYMNNWSVPPSKIILGLMPGKDDINNNLSLQNALNLTSFAKNNNLQGVMIWSSPIDSVGCDGNAPYAYSLGIESELNNNKYKLLKSLCCLRKRVNKKQYKNPPILDNKVVLKDGPPVGPDPPTPPTSPPLTIDEIKKIQANFERIYDMNLDIFMKETAIINEVFSQLKGQMAEKKPDPKASGWKEILDVVAGFVCIAAENPIIEAATLVVIGVSDYLFDSGDKFEDTQWKDLMLDVDCANILQRNTVTYSSTNMYLSYMHDDPNKYRDQQFTNFGKTVTVRDFINIEVPVKESVPFTRNSNLTCRQFRQQITIPEMIKLRYWDIYKIQDAHERAPNTTEDNFGWCFNPATPLDWNDPKYYQRMRIMDKGDVGNGARIHANDEVWARYPSYVHANGYGNNDDNLQLSYFNAVNSFIKQWPATIISPWCISNKAVYSYRWYILEGDPILRIDQPYRIANGDFMKWLFIDDGVGNVLNEDGVIYRRDALKAGIFYQSYFIPDENILDDGQYVVVSDKQYYYPGCSDNVTSNRVYCGDF